MTKDGKMLPEEEEEVEKLLAKAESMSDKSESIHSAELLLLREIASKSSDLLMARRWKEFREMNGGIEVFEKEHCESVKEWERWVSEGEG